MEFEKISTYIQNLYESDSSLKHADYTAHMQLKEYIPTVDDEMAHLLRFLIRLTHPMQILEIGTSVGFSTTSMALAARAYGGKVTTIEFDDPSADQAEKNFIKAGVADSITLKRGDACQILRNTTGTYQLIFQDVNKKLYALLLEDCIRLLAPGGLLLADDALFPVADLDARWSDQVPPIQEYNERVMRHPQLESILLPVGDGVMVSVKK